MKQGIHPDYHPVVFEDSSTGVQSAASAGLKCVMVPDLILPTEKDRTNAAMICQNFFEFLKRI